MLNRSGYVLAVNELVCNISCVLSTCTIKEYNIMLILYCFKRLKVLYYSVHVIAKFAY